MRFKLCLAYGYLDVNEISSQFANYFGIFVCFISSNRLYAHIFLILMERLTQSLFPLASNNDNRAGNEQEEMVILTCRVTIRWKNKTKFVKTFSYVRFREKNYCGPGP